MYTRHTSFFLESKSFKIQKPGLNVICSSLHNEDSLYKQCAVINNQWRAVSRVQSFIFVGALFCLSIKAPLWWILDFSILCSSFANNYMVNWSCALKAELWSAQLIHTQLYFENKLLCLQISMCVTNVYGSRNDVRTETSPASSRVPHTDIIVRTLPHFHGNQFSSQIFVKLLVFDWT